MYLFYSASRLYMLATHVFITFAPQPRGGRRVHQRRIRYHTSRLGLRSGYRLHDDELSLRAVLREEEQKGEEKSRRENHYVIRRRERLASGGVVLIRCDLTLACRSGI